MSNYGKYILYDDVLDTLKYAYLDVISNNGEDFKNNYNKYGLEYPLKQIKNDIKTLGDGLNYNFDTLLDSSLNGRKAEDILIDIGFNAIMSLYMFSRHKNMNNFIKNCAKRKLEKQFDELSRSSLADE